MKDMKKELYVKPEIVVVELEPEMVLAASGDPTFNLGDAPATDEDASDAQGRRGGGWGSLWD